MLSFFPFSIVAVIVYLIISVAIWRKNRKLVMLQVLIFVFFVYCLVVVSITLFPIPFRYYGGNIQANNLIPFRTIRGILSEHSLINDLLNIGGNILLFIPFGFLYPLVSRRANRIAEIVLLGFLATAVIESSQFIISSILGFTYRSFDVDDLILNTIGTFVGYLIFRFFKYILKNPYRFRVSKRTWLVASPFLVILVFLAYWVYGNATHSTPQKALESYDANVLSLEAIPFAKGLVLITVTDPSIYKQPGYVASYMEKTRFSGWRLKAQSVDLLDENRLQNGMSLQSMSIDGQTFVWGTSGNSGAEKVTYRDNGTFYTGRVDTRGFWHVILPFSRSNSQTDWIVIFPDGRIAPLFSYQHRHSHQWAQAWRIHLSKRPFLRSVLVSWT